MPPFFSLLIMLTLTPDNNKPFILPKVAADMFRLTGYQRRRRFLDLLTVDREMVGVRKDGSVPLDFAVTCANIARK